VPPPTRRVADGVTAAAAPFNPCTRIAGLSPRRNLSVAPYKVLPYG
jgi:hypothetical protein